MTEVKCYHAMYRCLREVQDETGVKWDTQDDRTRKFIEDSDKADLDNFEMKTKWALEAKQINDFLSSEGFDIRLNEWEQPPPPAIRFGVAAVLKILADWLGTAKKTSVMYEGTNYDAFELDQPFIIIESPHYSVPIARISMKNGDSLYLFPKDEDINMDRLPHILRSTKNIGNCHTLICPKVSYNKEEDMKWMIGMCGQANAKYQYVEIEQAVLQNKFELNEVGARVESAAAIQCFVSGCAGNFTPPSKYIINRPFYAILRRGEDFYFSGYFDTDTWSKE